MGHLGQCFVWILVSALVAIDYNCTSRTPDSSDCTKTDDGTPGGVRLYPCVIEAGIKCVADCAQVGETACIENGCNRIDNRGCFDDKGLKDVYDANCGWVSVRAQCLNSSKKCFWRSEGINYPDRDSGECIKMDCSAARNENECNIFKDEYDKPCLFFPDPTTPTCRSITCETLETEELCKHHEVPNVFCSWNSDTGECVDVDGVKTCETSGANSHKACEVASKYVTSPTSTTKCFFTDECKVRSGVSCGQLNLEECETLSFEYAGVTCKVQNSECVPVKRCTDTDASTTEIECASNYSETNKCFYLSSLPPVGNDKQCVFRDSVKCPNLKTQSKCIFNGIDGLYCEWKDSQCVDKKICEVKKREDCVSDSSCFFALDADSYFHDSASIKYERVGGKCYTRDANPRNDCAKFVNPNQCNDQVRGDVNFTLPDGTVVSATQQDCLYSICNGQSECEGKCVPWSMIISPQNDNLDLIFKDDCKGMTDPQQCQSPRSFPSLLSFCNYTGGLYTYCSGCQPGDGGKWCKCETVDDDNTTCTKFSYELDKCKDIDKVSCDLQKKDCVWFINGNDKYCRLRSDTTCDMISNKDDCKALIINDDVFNCLPYGVYFQPGYQEVVDWRCRNYVENCGAIADSMRCNDAGSGDGQTCFWLENETLSNLGRCVNPTKVITTDDPTEHVIMCKEFGANQCPVTDAQLLPFVGAKSICQIIKDNEGKEKCDDSNFVSIPNYCAQFKYNSYNDPNYTLCTDTKMCMTIDLNVQEGVCLPDSAKPPECGSFKDEASCRYVDFTSDEGAYVGINCEYLRQNSTTSCVDANFVQCEDLTISEQCVSGIRKETGKCLDDSGTCKINRCMSATSQRVCEGDGGAQNGGCQWNGEVCEKKSCDKYSSTNCPVHCSRSISSCASYTRCADVTNIGDAGDDNNNCTNALPTDGKRCYVSDNKCVPVVAELCGSTTIQNECNNAKPKDGYGCKWDDSSEQKCQLREPPACQSIYATKPSDCIPEGRLFAFFSEWCDFRSIGNEKICQPNCAAIENMDDCRRESKFCDQFRGNKCKTRYLMNSENSDCTISGRDECVGRCNWTNDETGCEEIPVEPAQDNSKMNRAVIIGSVIGGVVILLLIVGIIVVILLYIRMKKKHEEEEARLQREADAEANNEDEGELGYGGGGGGGGESKNVSMNANTDENADAGGATSSDGAGASSSSGGNENSNEFD